MARISNSVFIDGVAKFKKNLVKIKKRVGKLFRSCVSSDQDDHFDLASPPTAPLDDPDTPVNGPAIIEPIDVKVLDQPAIDAPAVADTVAEVLNQPAIDAPVVADTVAEVLDQPAIDAPVVAVTDAKVHVDKLAADAPESVQEESFIRRLYNVFFNAKSQVFIYSDVYCQGSKRFGWDQIRSVDEISLMLNDVKSNPEIGDEVKKISVFRVGHQANSRAFHAFVVFQTGNYCYSIERFSGGICMQRSKKIEEVCCSFSSWQYGGLQETEWINGKGTVGDVIRTLISEENVLSETFNIFTRNCQCFAALVFQKFNSDGKKFRRYRKYRPIVK